MLPAANSPRKSALQACTEGHSKIDFKKKKQTKSVVLKMPVGRGVL